MGYTNVTSMSGGFGGWKGAGHPWEADRQFTPDQLNRYSRHFLLPEVGEAGQAKLLDAKVLCIGAGGLGSPTAYYLAAAGVGTIGIVDMDVVDVSNLQRQILHTNDRVGMPKVESARLTLNALNPDIKVIGYQERVTSDNIMELISGYDVIVDGCDNFPTRYLVNDACFMAGKPNVHGSIFQFEGQATVFAPVRGPCYRCLFPEPPPPGAAPSCQEAGVLGVLPGLVGCVQALETMKLILGVGKPLIGRLQLFDGLAFRWRELSIKRDPACPVCGDAPTIRGLIDYEEFCGVPQAKAEEAAEHAGIPEVTATQLKRRLDNGDAITIIDVRETHEWDIANLGPQGALLIPLGDLTDRMGEVELTGDIVVHCRSGARSAKALRQLQAAGIERVYNLKGGILAWSEEVDPNVPRY
jgi:adenylyltransferase/sulfurtransferase